MQLNTKHFGPMEVDENGVIDFPEGIPSFENVKKYVLLASGDEGSPFKWLQSVDKPDLAFALVDPFVIKKDYEINIDDDTMKVLDIEKEADVVIYSIVVVPEDVAKMSMNLKAPVIINTNSRKGMQVILDTDKYGVRHYILEELRRQEVGEDACSNKEEGAVDCNK